MHPTTPGLSNGVLPNLRLLSDRRRSSQHHGPADAGGAWTRRGSCGCCTEADTATPGCGDEIERSHAEQPVALIAGLQQFLAVDQLLLALLLTRAAAGAAARWMMTEGLGTILNRQGRNRS